MQNSISETLEDLRKRARLTDDDLANIAAVSMATISQWTSGHATPDPHTQLVLSDLRQIVDRLAEFYTPDETRIWLHSKNTLLAEGRAVELTRVGRTEEVLSAIEGISAATYL